MVRPLTTIALVMASYSEGYNQNSVMMKLASSILSGGKYLLDPELRAEKVCDVWRFFDSYSIGREILCAQMNLLKLWITTIY